MKGFKVSDVNLGTLESDFCIILWKSLLWKRLSFLTCPYSRLCRASLKCFHCDRGHIRGNFCKLSHCMLGKKRPDSWFGLTLSDTDRNSYWDQRPKNCLGHWQNSCLTLNLNLEGEAAVPLDVHEVHHAHDGADHGGGCGDEHVGDYDGVGGGPHSRSGDLSCEAWLIQISAGWKKKDQKVNLVFFSYVRS